MALNVLQILRKAQLKVTLARKTILNVFSFDCNPINAEYIYENLKGTKINLVTIYRTLALFEESGIIKRVDLRKNSIFYELADHHHHHLVCIKCGITEGFENCNVTSISKKVLKKSSLFKSIEQHSLELFGLCKSCLKR